MIHVRVKTLPPDSAVSLAVGGSGWGWNEYLLADVFHATAGEPHPALPAQTQVVDQAREKRIRKARARARERQRAIDAGEIK